MSKILFTSIAALRGSYAQAGRVTTVENSLKKINPAWNSNWYFPAVAVGLSNSMDDVSWVTGNDSVLLDPSETINIEGVTISGSALMEKMGVDFESTSTRVDAQTKLDRVDAIMSEIAGKLVKWSTGLVVGAGATAAPELKQALSEDTPEQTAADAAVDTLNKLSIEDVLAVVLRVSVARGGLLNGVTAEESAAFLSALDTKGTHVSESAATAA